MKTMVKKIMLCAVMFVLILTPAALAEDTGFQMPKDDAGVAVFNIFLNSFYTPDPSIAEMKDVEAMIKKLQTNDKWAAYYDAETYAQMLMSYDSKTVGVGVYITANENGEIAVTGVMLGGPAETAGIQEGDIVTHINGVDVKGKDVNAVVALAKGEKDTVVTFTTKSKDGTIKDHIMIRMEVNVTSVNYQMLQQGIGYVKIVDFHTNTAKEIEKALTDLKAKGAKGIILDLQDCPGGLLDSVLDVTGYFAPYGPGIFMRYAPEIEDFALAKNHNYTYFPLVVLVNENTASAAELLTANIQDAHTGTIIGTKTYGKGLVQHMFQLPSGAGMKFTTSQYLSRGYQDIDANKGITPDIVIADAQAQMDRAIQLLSQQIKGGNVVKVPINRHCLFIDDKEIYLDNMAYQSNDTTYLPLRDTVAALGWTLNFDKNIITINSIKKLVQIDTANKKVVGSLYTDSMGLQEKNGVTYVPARFFSQFMNCDVTWDNASQQVIIKQNR